MPTISQLSSVIQVTSADLVPLSQEGVTHSVSVGTLLAGLQPVVYANTGQLLGRTSLGPGGPEPVSVGIGLQVNGAALEATGSDHAGFPDQPSLQGTDRLVISSEGEPRLLELSRLRGLFSAGENVEISPSGTISASVSGATSVGDISGLPPASPLAATDLLGVSQEGVNHAVTYADLINGQTIGEAQFASPAQDSDEIWVAQGDSTMLRQTFGAVWEWVASKLGSLDTTAVELTLDTQLDHGLHNRNVLVCSQPVSVNIPGDLASGFGCEIINLSNGPVSLNGNVVTAGDSPDIPAGRMATLPPGSDRRHRL